MNDLGGRSGKRYDERGYHEPALDKRMRREDGNYQRSRDEKYQSYARRDDDRWSREEGYHQYEQGSFHRRVREEEYDAHCYGPRSYRREEDEWRCLECEKFPGDVKCIRCCNRSIKEDSPVESQEVDEFGRSRKTQDKPKTLWPPQFEESGSAFVLDNRSGMFYESKSDFFYDPKTKMYYGNKERAYFTFNPETKRFQKTEKRTEGADPSDNSTDLVPIMDNSTMKNQNESKKAISIKLTTKALPKTSRKAALPAAVNDNIEIKVAKKHAANMEKWTVRQSEKRAKPPTGSGRKLVRTVKGEPVCLVCRRKFKSVEKLRFHEQASELHKENLAKTPHLGRQYADRAQRRRELHDDSDVRIRSTGLPGLVVNDRCLNDHDGKQGDAAASSEIGESMLRKLGWKPGENPTDSTLRREWSRIEAMAANGKPGVSRAGLGSDP